MMRNLWIALAVLCEVALSATAANGLSNSDFSLTPFGSCFIQSESAASSGNAYMALRARSNWVYPGGSGYSGGTPFGMGSITSEDIASCFYTTAENVSALLQNGADSTYNDDSYIGFAFFLSSAAGGLSAGWHEYSMGTGTLIPSDTTDPTVAITGTSTTVNSVVPFSVTITFSEAVSGFEVGDITVGNGSATNLQGSGTTYTADITPDGAGDITIDVSENVAVDTASNGNTAATQVSVLYDAAAPTVAVTGVPATVNSVAPFSVTITFSEAVSGFEVGDITVGNGSATNLQGSGTTYTAVITPAGTGDVTIDVAAAVAQDAATNNNLAATQVSASYDSASPTVVITGPSEIVTSDFSVTFTFLEAVTGFSASDVTVTNGTAGVFTAISATEYTLVLSPQLGSMVTVSIAANVAQDAANNGNTVSNTFAVQAGSPATVFAAAEDELRKVISEDAGRSLRSTLTSNLGMVRQARDRFTAGQDSEQQDVPFDVAGSLDGNGMTLSSKGTFFGQSGLSDGRRRLVFGDFDVQHDSDTGSSTATLNGRVAWEQMTSDKMMLGYFIGGELARSTLEGSFAGSQNRVGLTVGGYGVHQLGKNLYAAGFATLGMGRNNLDIASAVLDLSSDYTSRTATVGGALSGLYTFATYDLRPEIAVSYGKAWIGKVGFTGSAYGLLDDTLSLDVGNLAIANLTLRPEIVWALDGTQVADSWSQLSFAPRLVCELSVAKTATSDCGGGAEFGLASHSEDGLRHAEFRVIMDRVGAATQSSIALNLEHRF